MDERLDARFNTVPQGSVGAQARDAAYDLVARMRDGGEDYRVAFTRVLASLIYRSYVDDQRVEVPAPYR